MKLFLTVEETTILYQYLLKISFENAEPIIMQIRKFDNLFKEDKTLNIFELELTESTIAICTNLFQEMPLKHSYTMFNKLIELINNDIEEKNKKNSIDKKQKSTKRILNKS